MSALMSSKERNGNFNLILIKMKTFNIIQNSILTIIALFVISTSMRLLWHIVTTEGPGLTFSSISFGLIMGSFFAFLYYAVITLVVSLWKETLA